MRIGEVASQAGVSIQTLRYYERRGLLDEPARQRSGARSYDLDAVRRVQFIRRAQELGFTLDEIADLLAFALNASSTCGAVERTAARTLERIHRKIEDLQRMGTALTTYLVACAERDRVEACPLLDVLASGDEYHMRNTMRVQLVHDTGCPNVERARKAIREALLSIGAEPIWKEWNKDDRETPFAFRLLGSPTVLVDGRDVGCDEMEIGAPQGDSCRLYRDETGCLCGAPSAVLIASALRAERPS